MLQSPAIPTRKWRRLTRKLRNWIVGAIGPWLLRCWISTLRFRWVEPAPSLDPRGRRAVIYAFWHQRILALAYAYRGQEMRVLISSHSDGEMIARIVAALGYVPVRGSSTRGGTSALKHMLHDLDNGRDYAFTPDGPRGPREVFQAGAIFVASRSGLPLVPITVAFARSWRLPTWDGFVIPCPFTRAVVRCAEPLDVPRDVDSEALEAWRLKAQDVLKHLTDDTDRRAAELFGQGRRLCRRSPAAVAAVPKTGSVGPRIDDSPGLARKEKRA
jgi:hypothetical protein